MRKADSFGGGVFFAFCDTFMGKETGFSDKNSFFPDHTDGFVSLHFAICILRNVVREEDGKNMECGKYKSRTSPLFLDKKRGEGGSSKSCFGFFDRGINGKTAGFLKPLEFIPQGRRSDNP
jgi:hypothetical protein